MCSNQMNRKPDELVSSDLINPTMLASNYFNAILEQIQMSCLNFHIQVSPFSAIISLKKSFIKDKCGNLVLPLNRHVQRENVKNEPVVDKDALAEETIVKKEAVENDHVESLQFELNKLVIEKKNNEEKIGELEKEIFDLNNKVVVKNEIANKLNKQLRDLKLKNEAEVVNMKKRHKAEVKSWKKDLGEERRQKINLEKKIEEMQNAQIDEKSDQTLPEISASDDDDCVDSRNVENDPKPEQFPLTRTGFNYRPSSAAQAFSPPRNCSHTKQCILRQPFPPPLPALTPLVNMSSLYHTRILSGDLDWGSTCSYCFRIDYERYGCESCVWIKCFGDLHGYPDSNPYHYKKYLEEND